MLEAATLAERAEILIAPTDSASAIGAISGANDNAVYGRAPWAT